MPTELSKELDNMPIKSCSNRSVILHYHLFKNAGTSIDTALKEALGRDRWVTREFPADKKKNLLQLKTWIQSEKKAVAFSSHTASLPTPEIDGVDVFPIIFFRHPLDRIASAYFFESRQNNQSFGSTLAKHTHLAGYIDTRLAIDNDRQCRNFHANRLATMYPDKSGTLFERARKAIDALPFIGLVEHYNASILRLNQCLKKSGFEDVSLQVRSKNITRSTSSSLEDKLNSMRASIGGRLYNRLLEENEVDIELHRIVVKKYLANAEIDSATSL